MSTLRIAFLGLAAGLGLGLLGSHTSAHADWHHRRHDWHPHGWYHPSVPRVVVTPPHYGYPAPAYYPPAYYPPPAAYVPPVVTFGLTVP